MHALYQIDPAKDPLLTAPPTSKAYKNAATQRRMKFLNKFQMMNSKNKLVSIITQSLADPSAFFHCENSHWPVCLFDFTFKSILPEYLAYRAKPRTYQVIEDYFADRKPREVPI